VGDPFQVIREIGRGATGAVYEASVPGHQRPMAAKVLEVHTDQARLRFEREYAVMSRFRHPNVATAHGFGVLSSGAPYLVFDLVQGGTLEDVLEAEGPLTEERVRELLTPVASGLAHAHSLGTTHRDLKPANILMTRAGTPIVSDFGVAQSLELERMTMTGAVVGTPAYMAPEQQRAIPGVQAGPHSDVYALGVILYEGLTGELPYASTDPRLKAPAVSPTMGRIVQRCLQEDPSRRYADASALWKALQVAEGEALGKGWLLAGVATLVLLPLLIAGLVLAFAEPDREPGASPLPTPSSVAARSSPSPTPSSPPAGGTWDLQLQVGDRQRGEFERKLRSAVGTQSLHWGVEHVVTKRDEQTITIRAKIVTGRFAQSGGTVVFDSEHPEKTSPAFASMGVLIGKEYSFRQDHRTGRVISVRGGQALMRLLDERGFGGLNWLADKNLRKMFEVLFGVLPVGAAPERWQRNLISKSWAVRFKGSPEGREVLIRGDYAGTVEGESVMFRGRYRWSQGQITRASAEFDSTDDMVGASKTFFTWALRPGRD
jgi:serine/threonine protein kinase